MSLKEYKVNGKQQFELEKMPTDSGSDHVEREEILRETDKIQKRICALQDRLYADGKEGLIIILQAMDAAGKDSTVKHVMSGVNPQGVIVHSFKQPTSEELAHDFLWRVNKCLPRRGMIALFNRSYYEDVLVVRVDGLNHKYHMADRIVNKEDEEFFDERYEQIRNYERYLYENSYRIVKIFLNVSKDTQKNRFLERIDDPEKNWKFSSSDLTVRAQWDQYRDAYQRMIQATATKKNPWYVIPADDKWYTRYLVSEAILKALEDIDPKYPEMPGNEKDRLAECREQLMEEK